MSISSAERMQKEGGKPGERAPSKKGREKGKEAKEVSTATNNRIPIVFIEHLKVWRSFFGVENNRGIQRTKANCPNSPIS